MAMAQVYIISGFALFLLTPNPTNNRHRASPKFNPFFCFFRFDAGVLFSPVILYCKTYPHMGRLERRRFITFKAQTGTPKLGSL
jgi:hypothetical protein